MRVEEGWTSAAIDHFADEDVCCVSPLWLTPSEAEPIVQAIGTRYGAGGRRREVGKGRRVGASLRHTRVDGPTLQAGFFRRQSVLDVGGFANAVGPELADVDLAVSLRTVGGRAVFEPDSVVKGLPFAASKESFTSGRQLERLFWRHADQVGLAWALAAHPFAVVGSLMPPSWRGFASLAGRLVGACDFSDRRGYRRQMQRISGGLRLFVAGEQPEHRSDSTTVRYRRAA
jgi:hypothetical protein